MREKSRREGEKGEGGVHLKLDVQRQRLEEFWT